MFPDDVPSGLPPIRGIEHQINFVLGSTIPNRPAYRSNLDETKELQRQVEELLDKEHVRESMNPCTVYVLLVPKKDETWRMCVDCRTNSHMVKIRGRILLKRGGMMRINEAQNGMNWDGYKMINPSLVQRKIKTNWADVHGPI